MLKKDKIVIYITCPTVAEGEEIASMLIVERLAACVNIIPAVTSIYYWKDKIERGHEVMLVCKSVSGLLEQLVDRVKKSHSYECPEIIAMPVIGGSEEYLKWVEETVL